MGRPLIALAMLLAALGLATAASAAPPLVTAPDGARLVGAWGSGTVYWIARV